MTNVPAAVLDSLQGLAFGDAFGDRWFGILRRQGTAALDARTPPPEPLWRWTDDTAQAVVLVRELAEGGGIVDQDRLALSFAAAYAEDTHRGYGASMHDVLRRIQAGEPWNEVVAGQFGGQGSWGNGAAMRAAPLGAWHSGDLDVAAEQAARQSAVSHHHPEAVTGAVAVALAAALAARSRGGPAPARPDFLRAVAERLPDSDVRSGCGSRPGCRSTRRYGTPRRSSAPATGCRGPTPSPTPCGARRGTSTTCTKLCGSRSAGAATSTPPVPSREESSRPAPASAAFRPRGTRRANRCRRSTPARVSARPPRA